MDLQKKGQLKRVHIPLMLLVFVVLIISIAQQKGTATRTSIPLHPYTGFVTEGGDAAGTQGSGTGSGESTGTAPTIFDVLSSPSAFALDDSLDADGITAVSNLVKTMSVGKTKMTSEMQATDKNYIVIQSTQGKEATLKVTNGNLYVSGGMNAWLGILYGYKNYKSQLSKAEVTTVNGQLPVEQAPTPTAVCSDTDGGADAYTSGSTTGPQSVKGSPVTLKDECKSYDFMGTKAYYLEEKVCENNIVGTYSITCVNGCKDGACLEAQGIEKGQKCKDTDGDNVNTAGEVTGTDDRGHTYRLVDMCASYGAKDYVLEAICYSPAMYSRKGAYCPDGSGCSADKTACVPKQVTCTPSTEICDKKDNDCDGAIDEDKVCEQPMPSAADIVKQAKLIVIGAKAAASDNIASVDITQKYKNLYVIKDSAFAPGSQPAVLIIGGPCVNTAAQAYMGFSKPACGAESTIPEGGSIAKVYKYGTGYAVVVAGWNAEQTRKAAGQISEVMGMAQDRLALLMVAVVAIVGIFGIVQLAKGATPMIGYVVSSGSAPSAAAPPEPVPFALSKCGNKLCELGFEDNVNCPEDCPVLE